MSRIQGLIAVIVTSFLGYLAWNGLGGAILSGILVGLAVPFLYGCLCVLNPQDKYLREIAKGAADLIQASKNGHLDVVKATLVKGDVLNAKAPALIVASQNGHLDVVQALLAREADVNAKDKDGKTALIRASQEGHLDITQALLAKGADVNAKTNDGKTALDVATAGGHADVRAFLLKEGDKNEPS